MFHEVQLLARVADRTENCCQRLGARAFTDAQQRLQSLACNCRRSRILVTPFQKKTKKQIEDKQPASSESAWSRVAITFRRCFDESLSCTMLPSAEIAHLRASSAASCASFLGVGDSEAAAAFWMTDRSDVRWVAELSHMFMNPPHAAIMQGRKPLPPGATL